MTFVTPAMLALEFRTEGGAAGLPEALPPRRQREAQHGGAVLQHEEGDRREP